MIIVKVVDTQYNNNNINYFAEAVPVPEGHTLEEHLRSLYCNSSQLGGTTDWPPTIEVEYVNLQLISQKKIPQLRHQEASAKLLKHGEIDTVLDNSQQLFLSDIANYSTRGLRKLIVVEGVPGVGKTTFAYKLCRDWANKKLLTEYWLLVYIPLRVPLMRVAESADDLLKHYEKHCSPADIDLIKMKQGHGVLFILDGWDELRPACRVPTSFFYRFVCGHFLPQCSILITSRPGAVTHGIRTRIDIRLVEILGFTADQVTQYIRLYFEDYAGAAEKLTEELKIYPNVGSTCYVAINLTILCYVYLASEFNLPTTLTEVYEQFVIHAIKRHFNRLIAKSDPGSIAIDTAWLASVDSVSGFTDSTNQVLTGLGRLALNGLDNGDLSYSNKEVTRTCDNNEPDFDGFGLLKIITVYRKHGPEYHYQFLHLTVQEYLAAYTIYQMKEHDQVQWLQHNISNPLSCDQVFKFFCGIDQFKSHPARSVFTQFITSRTILESITVPFVLECLFEGQWTDGCHTFAQESSSTIIIHNSSLMQPYRALVYGYVITSSESQWQLQWKDCVIGEHELTSIGRYLQDSPRSLKQVSLIDTSFASIEATRLFSRIIQSQLELAGLAIGTKLDNESLRIICQALGGHLGMKTITITQISISQTNSDIIASLLSDSIETLDLSGCELDEATCRGFLRTIFTRSSLQMLRLPQASDAILVEINQLIAERKEKNLNEIEVCFS